MDTMTSKPNHTLEFQSPEPRDFITIFLVSCAVMVFQIAITRVLSVVVWYHFAFFTISLVMLGLGVPGVWFALVKKPERFFFPSLLLSGITVPAALIGLLQFGYEALDTSILYLVAFVLPATLSLGAVVCLLLIKATGKSISRMYGVDLIGACLGALIVIPLMHIVPTPHLVVGCGLLPLLALVLYPGLRRWAALGTALVLCVLLVDGRLLTVKRTKSYDERTIKPAYVKWSPTARIAIFDKWFGTVWPGHKVGFTWGRGKHFPSDKKNVTQYWLEQDSGAGTPITAFNGNLDEVDYILYDVTTTGYQVYLPKSAALIGPGGGRDILSALLVGTKDIDAIELNRHIIGAVSGPFAHISGDIYHRDGVNAFANEGRSHLTHTEKRYDLIQISLIDSWAASVAGAFALAENNLYTVEAFQLYFDRLTENGVLSISRWTNERVRLAILARSALKMRGVVHPERHIMFAMARFVTTMIISNQPIDKKDIECFREVCEKRGFLPIYPVQEGKKPIDPLFVDLIEGRNGQLRDLGLEIDPPVDDSPYFFQMVSPFKSSKVLSAKAQNLAGFDFNLRSSDILRKAMFWVSGLAILLFSLPFVQSLIKSKDRIESLVPLTRGSIYFAAIGAGFMLLENMLVQRFVLYLGHPSYAVTVILASLLLGMGLGSNFATYIGVDRLKRFGFIAPLFLILLILVLTPFFTATLGLSLSVRILISLAMLTPVGVMLGLFFPIGMLCFGDTNKPWFWAINGAFGVVASVMSLSLSMEFGYAIVGIIATVIYFIAWLCLQHHDSSYRTGV
jgi:hypothetical protein